MISAINSFILALLLSDPPLIHLRLGPSLHSDNIKEGDDVYFECSVRSNPPIRALQWEHNVSLGYSIALDHSIFTTH
jgi:hypothetical protein